MTDDGKNNLLDYDYWGRPRKIKNKSNVVASEYRYNGLGWRISFSDESTSHTYHLAYDDRWRNIATYVDSDDPADPKERMVYHNAGAMGYGGSSYIDSIVLRDKDANTAWTAASDGTLEERLYLLQNWRSDVVFALEATGSGNGEQVEHVRYEAYGAPTTLPAGDMDRDGDTDSTDTTQIDTWISGTTWDARGDLDLDNDVDATDKTLATAMSSANGGRHILSDRGNRKGYAGYEWELFAVHDSWQVKHRMLNSQLGRWNGRVNQNCMANESCNLYATVSSAALTLSWSWDLFCSPCPPQSLLNDPAVQVALQEAQRECGCTPTFICSRFTPLGQAAALPGVGCPIILLPCPTNSVSAATVAHELRHAWQFCKYPVTSPFTACEELICRELDAYTYDGSCTGGKDCCEAVCNSVGIWALGICDLLNDCECKCEKFIDRNWCEDGHFVGPIWWWL